MPKTRVACATRRPQVNIEQKALLSALAKDCFKMRIDGQITAEYDDIFAALQSAVAGEREECAKEVNAELESIKDEDAEVRAIQRLLKVRTRIRARGQKETA